MIKNKQIIFSLFLFIFLVGGMTLSSQLINVGNVHADSDDDEAELEDDSDDRGKNREKDDNEYRFEERVKYDGALGIPTRMETREETRISGEKMEIRERIRLMDDDHMDQTSLRAMFVNWGECRFAVSPTVTPVVGAPDIAAIFERRCAGDINQDGIVDISDLEKMVALRNDDDSDDDSDDSLDAEEIIGACRSVRDVSRQKICLLQTLQDREVRSGVRAVSWVADDSDDDSITPGKSVEQRASNYLRYMSNMLTRMQAAVERLETLGQRIESRIVKLEEEGLDMSEPKELLTIALEKLDDAKVKITEISENYDDAVETDDPKTFFEGIRETITEIKNLLKEVHQSFVDVIVSIKAGLGEETEPATTSAVNS